MAIDSELVVSEASEPQISKAQLVLVVDFESKFPKENSMVLNIS